MISDKCKSANTFVPLINTGASIIDLGLGDFKPAYGGGYALFGGLPPCLGIMGRPQTFKSALAGSMVVRALEHFKESQAIIYETEGNVQPDRYNDFITTDPSVGDRIKFIDGTQTNLSEFYELIKSIIDEKLKNKKDYLVDSPFIDKEGKPIKIFTPTFVLIDSFSRARSNTGDKKFDDNEFDDSALNTIWMMEGKGKTNIMYDMPLKAASAGVYVVMTAHIGDNMSMDTFTPPSKQISVMKQKDKVKHVGSGFMFLTNSLLQTMSCNTLLDSNKECLYPFKTANNTELSQLDILVVRAKTNGCSGAILPMVVSKYQGILDDITALGILKEYKYPGLDVKGNGSSITANIYPDVSFNRKNIRSITEKDYKLKRALELTAELCFIQNVWGGPNLPDFARIPMDKFGEEITKFEKSDIDRMLTGTGVWTTDKGGRERITIYDVLAFIAGKAELKHFDMKKK